MSRPMASSEVARTDSLSDTQLREFLGYRLKRAYMVVHRAASNVLQQFELGTRSFTVLSLVAANPGASLSQLADLLLIERSNMVLILDDLETRELVKRSRDPNDRRRYLLKPTLQGLRVLEGATAAAFEEDKRLARALNDEEFALLMSLLRRVEEGASAD
ncbi:MarR family winged helix-turn-helix transcriptional regulator [Donghicola mangrovi]|uniref:MarR family transcriptional regulator n=1 Tax=Donghicola mangrovi TaxID=2729614 RepID=A0A850QFB9_9RHOB|nr:MarR family transcriptional regulator [Donghicola mangrovi]NVO25660.1 MarR family transcriptional regulator [Donghicola mangrovi]